MLTLLTSPEAWLTLATLTLLEIVLGVDNIIFLTILVSRLPAARQDLARRLGLSLAMLTRLGLLFSIVWLAGLTRTLFVLLGSEISIRDLILGGGGALLIVKSIGEILVTLRGAAHTHPGTRPLANVVAVVIQIALVDIVFSLDSVFTAVGLARPDQIAIMAAAIVISVLVMMGLSGPIGRFVERQPSIKILSLAFLILIGAALIGEAFDLDLPKGYLYFALVFALLVELINIRLRRLSQPR